MRLVDEGVFERATKMQPAWARLTAHALALGRRPRRFDADDAKVKETAPAGDVGEQLPYDADRRFDDLSGTSQVIRRHGEQVSLVVAGELRNRWIGGSETRSEKRSVESVERISRDDTEVADQNGLPHTSENNPCRRGLRNQ